jgi:hypothetical protein
MRKKNSKELKSPVSWHAVDRHVYKLFLDPKTRDQPRQILNTQRITANELLATLVHDQSAQESTKLPDRCNPIRETLHTI